MFNLPSKDVLIEMQRDVALIETALTTIMIMMKEQAPLQAKTLAMCDKGIGALMKRTIEHTLALGTPEQGEELLGTLHRMVNEDNEKRRTQETSAGSGEADAGEPQPPV